MTLAIADNKNYIQLGHLYELCLKCYKMFPNEQPLFETILLDHFGPSVYNYQLPVNSLLCQRKPENIGNTILHLIVGYSLQYYDTPNERYFNTFIKLGADFTIKNSNGHTPLLLAFNGNQICNSLLKAHTQENNTTNIRCKNGISHFHVACSSDQVEVVDFFLKSGVDVDERVNSDSAKFPGYTPLHFASEYCQFKTIKLLLKSGANWNTEDANGISALHLLIKKLFARGEIDEMRKRKIQSDVLKLPDSIGLTRLHLDSVQRNPIHLQTELQKDAIDSAIRFDSPLWPGQTPLHFAAQYSYNSETICSLVERGADILAKDATGTTSLDLLLEHFQIDDIICILSRDKRYGIPDLKFTNDIYLLEALKAIENASYSSEALINKQLKDVNVYLPLESPLWAGYNLLHFAVMFDISENIIKKLLSQNVDFITLTRGGTSPLHLAFHLEKRRSVDIILSYHNNIPANPVDQDNVSHLHIACAAGNKEVVELLLKNGADPNLHIQQDFKWNLYIIRKGSTALHVAFKIENFDLIIMLLSFQANLKATDADGITPFQYSYNKLNLLPCLSIPNDMQEILELILESYTDQITNVLAFKLLNNTIYNSSSIQYFSNFYKRLILVFDNKKQLEKLGLTRLQVACALSNLSMVKEELKSGAEVNHRISYDSPLWPGNTAMHILFRKCTHLKYKIAKLLLDYGADPTLKNADDQTVIHLNYFENGCTSLKDIPFLLRDKYTKINPVDNEGLSHLHICCQTDNVLIIEQLLKSGANVNAQVDYFTDVHAGYTPLHFAIMQNKKKTVELLINYGADPNIKTAIGNNALHFAAVMEHINANVVKILIRCPTIDLQAENGIGQTILEQIISYVPIDYRILNILLKKSFKISKYSKVFLEATFKLEKKIFKKLINNLPDLTAIDLKGQNAIHHIASNDIRKIFDDDDFIFFRNYCHDNIEELIYLGCEINHKDHQGKTPLHIATSKLSSNSDLFISLLLNLGADVNIKDDSGKTPCVDIPNGSISYSISEHIYKLEMAEIFVDNSNKKFCQDHILDVNSDAITAEKKMLDVKLKEIHSSCSVKYFFSESFVVDYRRLPAFQRQAVCNFCNMSDLSLEFPELYPLIRRQYRKARSRTRLLEPAENALQKFVNVTIPQLCLDFIHSFLSNDDLMNLIRAENGGLIFVPLPKNC